MKKKRNNSMKRKMLNGSLAAVLALTTIPLNIFPHTAKAAETDSTVQMRFMETTDLHSNVMDYDYYKDAPVNNFGLDRTAVLIQQARDEQIKGYPDGQTYTKVNSMLFDDGDLLQGNPLADYVHKNWNYNDSNAVHPLFRAMKMLDYDAGNVGNHEFNFGLNYLESVLKHAPYNDGVGRDGIVNANIYVDDHDNDPSNDKNYFKPYNIIDKVVTDSAGNQQHIKVGVIGFAPPQIMNWDKDNLQGKVIAKDMVETAKKFIPEMKANGADIIVALAHSGCDVNSDGQQDAENAVYSLTKVPGIDVMLFGHAHVTFPSDTFKDKPGIDITKGTINNVPAMEAGFWGNNLGVMDLTLQNVNGKWTITNSEAAVRPLIKTVKDANGKDVQVPTVSGPDQDIVNAVKDVHNATLNYVRAEIGKTSAPMYSYFAQVQDDPTIQIVNNAQTEYVKKWIANNKPELSNIPVLSAGAPFKAGGTSGPAYYTEINAGPLSISSANDLYLYPNTLKAIEITGATVREWLEMSAGQFNTIDPNKNNPQNIINTVFKSYNFDVIDGVKYQIDITKPPKYSEDGKTVLNPNSHRIVNLTMPDGTPVKDDQVFIVATNNYRAGGGGNFPGIDGKEKYIIDSQDESREVLINYIKERGTVNPTADNNWSLARINGTVQLTFLSAPKAKTFADQSKNVKYLDTVKDANGQTWGSYEIVAGPAIPELDYEISQFDTVVSGTAEPGSKVEVKVDGKVIGSVVAEEDGYFEIEIPVQKVGTQLVITATDASGNVSKPLVTTVYEEQSGWVKDEGKWYYVDPTTGEFKTGWFKDGNKWYYLDPTDFDMKTGWVKVNNKWYYLDPTNGDMKAGWVKVNNKWYYLDPTNGDMKAGWVKVNNKWYYLDPTNGDMKAGWIKVANKWYYLDPVKGDMKAGWVKVANKWYYLDPVKGDMKTGWVKVNNKWYYLATSGAMQTGWVQVGKKWYFLYNDGSMASNTKIGKYKVGKDGARI